MDLDIFSNFQKYFNENETVKVVFSDSNIEIKKIIVKPIKIKTARKWQIEKHLTNKTFHTNLTFEGLLSEVSQTIIGNFRQINIINVNNSVQIFLSKSGKVFVNKTKTQERKQNLDHNRPKHYIFNEGDDIAPLRDLGVFTFDNKIIKEKFNKYKQINRFIEIVIDEFKTYEKNEITIMDFGCGKSYLTFLIYYYFKFIKKIKVKVFAYDLKQDVVDECNSIAKKYGYSGLEFINTDIVSLQGMNYNVDMLITLHACDVATDYALFNAIKNNIKYIFSVPCCQHEINAQINSATEMNLLLNDGLIKERFSALLTDAIRCEILRQEGYNVDVIEFVDFNHSPKNLMIRANLIKNKNRNYENVSSMLKHFNCSQKLFSLINGLQK